jgi:hypothetical protein
MSNSGTLEGILELGFAFRGAKVLMSAVELGLHRPGGCAP